MTGTEIFIIANADTVMSRPNAALVARFYPEVEVRGDLGERHHALDREGQAAPRLPTRVRLAPPGDVLDERGRGSSSVWPATSALPAAIFSSVRGCPSEASRWGGTALSTMPRNVAVVEANLRRRSLDH